MPHGPLVVHLETNDGKTLQKAGSSPQSAELMSEQNQHYIPKFLLRNFVDSDGRVFCLNTQTDIVTKPPPKKAGSRSGFNEFMVRGQLVSFEDRFQKIETKAAPVLRKMIEENSLSLLTISGRSYVADFIASQSFRTEAFRNGLISIEPNEIGEIFEQLWRSAFIVSSEIQKRHWILMKIEYDDIFYLGDQPVALQDTEHPEKAQSLGFDIKGVEAFLPLTPKHALYMPCLSTSHEIISGYETGLQLQQKIEHAQLNRQELHGVDDNFVKEIARLINNPRQFTEAALLGNPLVCIPENVENLNYLQCAWASRHVFSNRKDFSFARHVFSKTPQYRATMQTSIESVWPKAL